MKLIFYIIILTFNIYSESKNFLSYNEISPEFKQYENIDSVLVNYKSNISNEIFLKAISQEYKHIVTYHNLGETHLKNKIPAINITNNNNKNKLTVLFNCAHHADELISTEHCYDIIHDILNNENEYKEILNNIDIWVVPIVNPDGSYFFWNKSILMGRKNGWLHSEADENNISRGADLNRNYSFKWNSGHPTASSANRYHSFYRGTKPFSEPESLAMSILAEQKRFLFSISFHSHASRILFPYTIENVKNPSHDYPKYFAYKLAKLTKKYRAVKNLYPVDGTDQDYYYFRYGTIALIVESSQHNPPYNMVKKVTEETKIIWQTLLNECLNGEKIFLKIIDEDGNNVEAEVQINDFKYYHGEKFTSNALTGLYQQMINENKNYQIIISHPFYETVNLTIKSSNRNIPEIVKLKKLN